MYIYIYFALVLLMWAYKIACRTSLAMGHCFWMCRLFQSYIWRIRTMYTMYIWCGNEGKGFGSTGGWQSYLHIHVMYVHIQLNGLILCALFFAHIRSEFVFIRPRLFACDEWGYVNSDNDNIWPLLVDMKILSFFFCI